MSRYFFHILDGRPDEDLDGIELTSLAEVRNEMARLAGELMREYAAEFWDGEPWTLSVEDESGREVAVLHLAARRPPRSEQLLASADD